jgi:hypothetical protein
MSQPLFPFSEIKNGFGGNFGHIYMIFKKNIFFIPKPHPHPGEKYLRILSKSIVRIALRECTRSIVHPQQDSRPRTIVAAGILHKTGGSAFLSAIERQCTRPADSRMCPRTMDTQLA